MEDFISDFILGSQVVFTHEKNDAEDYVLSADDDRTSLM